MTQIEPLTADLQKIANEELDEVQARIPDDLQAFKLWIEQQPHLKANTDDQFLIQFLRGCKYSLEGAKKKIDHFYALKTRYPELFHLTDVEYPKFRSFYNTGAYLPLPVPLNECGPRITIVQYKYSPQEFSMTDSVKLSTSSVEVLMMNDPYACINGIVIVLDFAHATTSHILQLSPSLVKNAMAYCNKAFTLRFKAMYVINIPTYAEHVIKLGLANASDKLKQRIIVCGKNSGKLTEHIPLKYLPREYGGENGSLDEICAEYNKVWDKYREYFKQSANYGTDERLRLGKPLAFDGDLSTEGSFRRLEVD